MEEKIRKLKEKLEHIGTRDLLGMIGIHFLTFANDAKGIAEQSDILNKTKLMSPQKQYTYLAGLLMSTDDKSEGIRGQNEDSKLYEDLEKSVQQITFDYIKTFLSIDPKSSTKDIKKNLVSMEAFTSYFDMGILRYPEQTIELIRTLYGSFDLELKNITGLTTEDFIVFYEWIFDVFEESMSTSANAVENIKKTLSSFNPYALDIDKEFERFLSFAQGDAGTDFQTAMDKLNTVRTTDIIKSFGKEKGLKLLDVFGLYRKERNFLYYNGKNPFAEKPLCWLDEGDTLFIVHPQFLLNAIYNYITDVLENTTNSFADKYKKSKADIVENRFLKLVKEIFGEQAKYHTSVCEERGTKEHDILVEYDKYILLIEAKASKVREPFFNPEKGYIRVKDHFNSDSGIGGAYNQAIILKKLIENKDSVVLYENKNVEFELQDIPKKTILPIVFTLNQFGGLAINTSMLLKKDSDQPYPWVCNLYDFENLIEILKYLKKTPTQFIEYVIWRSRNHARILSSDELDVAERYFVDDKIKRTSGDTTLFFPPNNPSLIEKIYFNKHGIPYEYPETNNPIVKKQKIGRNEPCPCGSDKKIKKCCLGKRMFKH